MYSRYFLQRNYRYFFMFVSTTNLLSLYVFVFCWVNIKKIMEAHHCNIWRALVKSPASGILIMYTFVVSWFLGGLTAFHLYLIITNQVHLPRPFLILVNITRSDRTEVQRKQPLYLTLWDYTGYVFVVLLVPLLTLKNVVFHADHI